MTQLEKDIKIMKELRLIEININKQVKDFEKKNNCEVNIEFHDKNETWEVSLI